MVLVMTGWNIHLVNQVQGRRQELETLQMDLRFLQANQTEIQDAYRQRSRLIHPVKSFGLGFLVIENNLKRLSWDFGLRQMQVEADMNSQDTQTVPIKVSTIGPVPSIVEWIAAVEDAYPYLVIEQMNVSYRRQQTDGPVPGNLQLPLYPFRTDEEWLTCIDWVTARMY